MKSATLYSLTKCVIYSIFLNRSYLKISDPRLCWGHRRETKIYFPKIKAGCFLCRYYSQFLNFLNYVTRKKTLPEVISQHLFKSPINFRLRFYPNPLQSSHVNILEIDFDDKLVSKRKL